MDQEYRNAGEDHVAPEDAPVAAVTVNLPPLSAKNLGRWFHCPRRPTN